jgi:beta-D-xylosidase 4
MHSVFFTDSGPFSSATAFPNGVNLGASFDDDLYEAVGNIIANETRAFNNAGLAGLTYYSPINVNPFRDPRWGRGQEVSIFHNQSFAVLAHCVFFFFFFFFFFAKVPGEDVYHIAQYAKKLIPAMQGTDPLHLKTVATCKHFLAYGKHILRSNEMCLTM